MVRKIKLDGLQAELSAVGALLKEAAESGDFVGKFQFAKRKEALQAEISAIGSSTEKGASVALLFGALQLLVLVEYQQILLETH
jgi:hypothetical protein